MRHIVLGVALASTAVACSDDSSKRRPPDTAIDDTPNAITNQTHVRITFHASGITTHFVCQLDAGAPSDCGSPFEADVTDGMHTFSVSAAFQKVVDDTPATASWQVDTVAPETTIASGPPSLDNSLAPEFTFQGTDDQGAVTFECSLDDAAFAACTSPAAIAVVDGSRRYRVRAVDRAGNIDPTPATTNWVVDSTAPDTAIITGPAAGATTAADVTFEFGSPDSSATLECSLDGAAFTACTSPRSFTLGDGPHTFAARARDAAGLVDPSPVIRMWTVDATAPSVMITGTPSNPSNSATGTFAFSSTDSAATFECRVDTGTFAPCTSGYVSPSLADGSHTFIVRATDPVGNSSTASHTWRIDTAPPTVTITSGPPNPTSDNTPSVTFTVTGGATAIDCRIDTGAFAPCTSPFTSASALSDGSHTITVRGTDAASNPGTASATFTVDTMPPAVMVTPVASPTNDRTPSVTFTVTGGATAIDCRVDTGAFAACTSPFTPATALTDGSHTITVRGTDAASNPGTGSTTFTVDTAAPVVTVTPVTSPTSDSTPSVTFTVTGGATQIDCRVDTGAFSACTSPFTPATALADGSHTITVRGTDAANNPGTGSTTFTVDTAAPALVFDDTPPAQWPVNYFDMKFHTTDASATITCSLNGAAFTACTSPHTITTNYNVLSTFAVRATDPVNNTTTISTTWTSSNGLVLHYPWEQGRGHNTSLLAQRPAYSPDAAVTLPVTGGWGGTATASPPAHAYGNTIRALSSSASGAYTASIWVRASSSANGGTILSTLATNNGIALTFAGRQVTLRVNENNQAFTVTAVMPLNQWVQLGMLTTGPGRGLQLLINGVVAGTVAAPNMTGFGLGQAPDLTVGSISGVDLDDLRFYNRALSSTEICTTLVRGQLNVQGACVPLIPGLELDFENNQIRDTGNWTLALSPPQQFSFTPTPFGAGLKLQVSDSFGYTAGFASRISQAPGHSFSFWFVAGAASADNMIDFLQSCGAAAPGTCGIRVTYNAAAGLTVVAGNGGQTSFGTTIPIPNGAHNVVVTERKAADGTITQSLTIYVDGAATVLPIGAGNVYGSPSDSVMLPRAAGTTIDEYEFWPRDLSLDPEMLCENGWDGEWEPATGVCLLTAN